MVLEKHTKNRILISGFLINTEIHTAFIIDNAYVVDFKNKVEFMVSAVVHSNEDDVYNDGKYEYREICYPFMKNLGQVILPA